MEDEFAGDLRAACYASAVVSSESRGHGGTFLGVENAENAGAVTGAPGHDVPIPPDPDADPFIGRDLAGRYRIERKLGEGGMGAVYLGRHLTLDKPVAIKVLHGEYGRKPDLVERFLQEAKAASRIRHENVIDITDFGVTEENVVFFAMECLEGQDLHELITRAKLQDEIIPWSRTGPIFLQICSALDASHSHGVIHRDLKPENIFLIDWLGSPDFVKLLDFGIAKMTTEENSDGRKLTKTGMLFGTPEYMSPEQARGETPDHRVDVYAMGCILFQLVTGDVPFAGETFMAVLSQHLTAEPPSVSSEALAQVGAPAALAAVISRSLEKDRNVRYGTIAELANAVVDASGTHESVASQVAAARTRSGWRGSAVIEAVAPSQTVLPHEQAASGAKSRRNLFLGIGLAAAIATVAVVALVIGGSDAKAPSTDPVTTPTSAGVTIDAGAKVAPTEPTEPTEPTGLLPTGNEKPVIGGDDKPGPGNSGERKPHNEPPVDSKPTDTDLGDKRPADKRPADKRPADKRPADKRPADKRPADKKPADKKPADKKPGDTSVKAGDVDIKGFPTP